MNARQDPRVGLASTLAFVWLCGEAPAQSVPRTTGADTRTQVGSAHRPNLRWAAFPESRLEIQRLQARTARQPLWFKDGPPSEAANQLIARLDGTDSLVPGPTGYYFARWTTRRAHQPATTIRTAASSEQVRFDTGLSVAAVRLLYALQPPTITTS